MIKKFYKNIHFLPRLWFLIKAFDLFNSPLWILESLDPRDRINNSNKVKCNLSVYLKKHCFLCTFLCFFRNWLPIINPKNDENISVLRVRQAQYISQGWVKIGGLLLLITSAILTSFSTLLAHIFRKVRFTCTLKKFCTASTFLEL